MPALTLAASARIIARLCRASSTSARCVASSSSRITSPLRTVSPTLTEHFRMTPPVRIISFRTSETGSK